MMTDSTIDAVQRTLGYRFKDPLLLENALTHSSTGAARDNESLACLGDRIHNLWVARRVFASMPQAKKGVLTEAINRLCAGGIQADVMYSYGLDDFVVVGDSIAGSHGSVTPPMASTAFEALVAAIEIDGGSAAAEAFLDRVMSDRIA